MLFFFLPLPSSSLLVSSLFFSFLLFLASPVLRQSNSLLHCSRVEDEKAKEPEPLPKVFDVDGAVRAPLSGIVKIDDSGKFMERVFESEKKAKTKKDEKENLRKMQEQQQQLTQMAQQVSL